MIEVAKKPTVPPPGRAAVVARRAAFWAAAALAFTQAIVALVRTY